MTIETYPVNLFTIFEEEERPKKVRETTLEKILDDLYGFEKPPKKESPLIVPHNSPVPTYRDGSPIAAYGFKLGEKALITGTWCAYINRIGPAIFPFFDDEVVITGEHSEYNRIKVKDAGNHFEYYMRPSHLKKIKLCEFEDDHKLAQEIPEQNLPPPMLKVDPNKKRTMKGYTLERALMAQPGDFVYGWK